MHLSLSLSVSRSLVSLVLFSSCNPHHAPFHADTNINVVRLAGILHRPLQPKVVDAPTEQHQLRVQIGGQLTGAFRDERERRPLDDALLQCLDRFAVAAGE